MILGLSYPFTPCLTFVHSIYSLMKTFLLCISSQPRDILCGAADEVLVALKDDKMKVHAQGML